MIWTFYDVVIMGGVLSGAATATLLFRQNRGIRILIKIFRSDVVESDY
jgi:2-polyprenyl-6-methoxyphenol hydroxylase-like FAD-dependent oxidoreductase